MIKKILVVFLLSLLGFSPSAYAKLKVVTTTTDLAHIAREVGGNLVEVKSLTRGSQDPHYIEPKPSYALLLNKANLLIQIGLSLEIGWIPPLLTQARNPGILPGGPGHLFAFQGLRILEIPQGRIDRSEGDIHPDGNPHYWLDPRNGSLIAENIAEKLFQLDPTNKGEYEENLRKFQNRLSSKITEWKTKTTPLKEKEIVAYHKTFSYFADFAGMKVMGYVEPKPGIPPSPSHLVGLIEMMKAKNIRVILLENYFDPHPADKVSRETGARVLRVPSSVEGVDSVRSYEGLFDFLTEHLLGVL